jgi:hypothetical protein
MRLSAALLGPMLLTLSACDTGGTASNSAGGSPQQQQSAQASAQSTDPCSLVSAEEVAQIVGEKIVAAKPAEGSCTYETEDAQASSVTIELNQTDAASQMDIARRTAGVLKDMGAEAAEQGGAAGQDVNAMLSESGDSPKIGDEAFFGANHELSVRKGNSYIAVSPPMMRSRLAGGNPLLSGEDKKKMATAIAEKAVARLP